MGITWWQILLIVGIGFLLFGARKLPELARSTGKSIKEFKKAIKDVDPTDDIRNQGNQSHEPQQLSDNASQNMNHNLSKSKTESS